MSTTPGNEFPDETVMAYADGELEPSAAARVEAAMARDPALARRVAAYRAQRELLGRAFGGIAAEPVPPQLVATARGARRPAARRTWRWPEYTALAASFFLGLAVAPRLLAPDAGPLSTGPSGIVAGGELARALETRLAADRSGTVQIGITFEDRSGRYCRSFALAGGQAVAGLACRDQGVWRIPVLAAVEDRAFTGGEYRPAAGALPPAVRDAIDGLIDGDALDGEAERTARDRGWQAP